MSRYIDADALKKRVSELIVPDWTRTLIRSWLDSEPTVDAVPVVRCGECRWWSKDEPYDEYGYCYNGKIIGSTKENWYCADGERRTE